MFVMIILFTLLGVIFGLYVPIKDLPEIPAELVWQTHSYLIIIVVMGLTFLAILWLTKHSGKSAANRTSENFVVAAFSGIALFTAFISTVAVRAEVALLHPVSFAVISLLAMATALALNIRR